MNTIEKDFIEPARLELEKDLSTEAGGRRG